MTLTNVICVFILLVGLVTGVVFSMTLGHNYPMFKGIADKQKFYKNVLFIAMSGIIPIVLSIIIVSMYPTSTNQYNIDGEYSDLGTHNDVPESGGSTDSNEDQDLIDTVV